VGDLFADGQSGSRSAFWTALNELQAAGQKILDDLEAVRQSTLAEFAQGLTALNGRHQRANRLLSADLAGQFVVSDFLEIDQAQTSATVRADTQAVTLRQRKTAPPVLIESQTFTSSAGSVESFGGLHQVYLPTGALPTGTFQIKFSQNVDLSLIVFDLLLTPSNPAVSVQVSPDGVYYSNASKITRNGARVSAYLPPGEIRFLTLSITPSMPDNIGGYTYTFGLDGFYPYQVTFHLESQLTSKAVTIYPQSDSVSTSFAGDDDITAFVSLDGLTFTNVLPGSVLPVPGAVAVAGDRGATAGSAVSQQNLAPAISPANYTPTPGTTFPLVPGAAPDGSYAGVLAPGQWGVYGSYAVPVTPGAQYTFSGYIDQPATSTGISYWLLSDVTRSTFYAALNQTHGNKGILSTTVTIPAGVTVVYVLFSIGGVINQTAGNLIFAQPTLTLAAAPVADGTMRWRDEHGTVVSTLPANVYPRSLTVLDANNNPVPIAAGLNPANATHVTKPVICWFNNTLTYRPYTGPVATSFSVSYVYGPPSLQAYLRVQLVSRDRAATPVFKGMTLVNV
jgi:hypothetical protein